MNDKDNRDVKYKSYFRDYTGENDVIKIGDDSSNNVHIINDGANVPYGRFVV